MTPKFHMLKALCPCMVLLGGSGNVQMSLEGSQVIRGVFPRGLGDQVSSCSLLHHVLVP